MSASRRAGCVNGAAFRGRTLCLLCRMASIHATHSGSLFGLAPTGRTVDIRVMDWWRRHRNLLVENWIFMDFPHLFLQLGIDLFDRMRSMKGVVPVAAGPMGTV